MIRLAILFSLFIGSLTVLADTRNLGPLGMVYDFRYGDKASHILLYGMLTLLLNLAAFKIRGRESAKLVAVISTAMLVYVSLDELSQLAFPSRSPDWYDLMASYIGVSWFACLTLFIVEWRKLSRSSSQVTQA